MQLLVRDTSLVIQLIIMFSGVLGVSKGMEEVDDKAATYNVW